jgi:hypothetical protein
MMAGLAAAGLVTAVIVFLAQSGDRGLVAEASAEFGHVHGLAVDHSTGALYAATHVGLFRIDGDQAAVRVSAEAPDLMGFTAVGPGHFLASGHPGKPGDGPANLGLLESTDGGVTWRTMSLAGAADFHGLQAAHDAVYGYNSTDGVFMVSTDRRTWDHRSALTLGAFIVSPTDPATVLAAGAEGLQRSTDGGRTWSTVPGIPAMSTLTWSDSGPVWGATRDGQTWTSADGGTTWTQRGQLPAQPQAMATHDSTVYAAVAGDEILASADGGATWIRQYTPGS